MTEATMQTIAVSFVNIYQFTVATTHYSAAGARLRLAELARAGYTATVSEAAPPSQRRARRRPGARKAQGRTP